MFNTVTQLRATDKSTESSFKVTFSKTQSDNHEYCIIRLEFTEFLNILLEVSPVGRFWH